MKKETPRARTSVTVAEASPLESGQVAAACASLGWRVLPLATRSGLPLIKQWQDRATTRPEDIEEWWGQRYHGAGVGIATGQQSGIWVVDLDVKNDHDGITALRKLEADEVEHGGDPLPKTFTVRTKTGGLHLYFRWPSDNEGMRNSSSMIAPGVDVRGDRGYVRAPIRAASIEDSTKPAVAPEWLLQRARWSRRYSSGDASAWRAVKPTPWMSASDLVEHVGLRLVKVGEGGRNDALNRAAFSLGLWGYDMGLTRDQAWNALRWACERNGLWEEEPEGCVATFASGWEAGIAATKEAHSADN